MKIDAFFNYWLGRKIDYDGAYGYQCVDWVRQYSKEVVQCSLGSF